MISRNTAVNQSMAIDHRQWYSTRAAPDSRRCSAGRNAIEATTTSREMVTTQTTMQYGHNAPMRYRLWKINQCTNTAPTRIPTVRPYQYHWGRSTFAIAKTPVTTTTVKPSSPSNGLGNARTDACGVTITEPHDTTGLMLHDGTYDGLRRMSIFSTVSVIEATKPITPAISTHHAPAAGTCAGERESGVRSAVSADTGMVTMRLRERRRCRCPARRPQCF